MSNLSHLSINQLKTLKSIFVSDEDWAEVSTIQYEIDSREKEFVLEGWVESYLAMAYIKHKKILIDEYVSNLQSKQ